MDADHLPPALDSFREALKFAKDPEVQARLELEIAFVSRRISPEEFQEVSPEEIPPHETFAEESDTQEKEVDPSLQKPKEETPLDWLLNLPYPDL